MQVKSHLASRLHRSQLAESQQHWWHLHLPPPAPNPRTPLASTDPSPHPHATANRQADNKARTSLSQPCTSTHPPSGRAAPRWRSPLTPPLRPPPAPAPAAPCSSAAARPKTSSTTTNTRKRTSSPHCWRASPPSCCGPCRCPSSPERTAGGWRSRAGTASTVGACGCVCIPEAHTHRIPSLAYDSNPTHAPHHTQPPAAPARAWLCACPRRSRRTAAARRRRHATRRRRRRWSRSVCGYCVSCVCLSCARALLFLCVWGSCVHP